MISRVCLPRFSLLFLGLVAASLVSWGCGYALVGRASNIPEDVRTVYVEPLENRTSRQQVEQILTQAILDEMVTRRRFEVVNSAEQADAILRGIVTSFEVRPVTFDAAGLADNFEIRIDADMRFERPPRGGAVDPEVIWKNSRYRFREDYPLEQAGISYFDRETLAIEETSEAFAETLVTDILEGF